MLAFIDPSTMFVIDALFSPASPGSDFLILSTLDVVILPRCVPITMLLSYIPWPSDAKAFVSSSIKVNVPMPIILSLIYKPNDFE